MTARVVWAADSFAVLPPPAEGEEADAGDTHFQAQSLGVSLDEVRRNFAKYGVDDEKLPFLEGWFSDTLPTAPIESLAVV